MKALLVSSSPGTGKTSAVAAAIRRHGVSTRIVAGSLKLAREQAAEHGYALIEGRNPTNCQRHQVVRALGEAGHDVEKLACGDEVAPACPFRSNCAYFQQFGQPGPRVGAAEQMYNPHFLFGGSLLVVDDADLTRSMISRFRVTADELGRSYKQLRGKRRAALRDLLTLLGHAVLDGPNPVEGEQPLMGAAVWDHLARNARLYGHHLEALMTSIPARPKLPEPVRDSAGLVTVQAVDESVPAKLLEVLRALRDEVELFVAGEDFNSSLRLTRNGLEVSRIKDPPRGRWGESLISEMDVLVLDATPVRALVDRLTCGHERLPDLEVTAQLPEGVRVKQYATSTNGHGVLKASEKATAVLSEVSAEQQRRPVSSADKEGVVCFRDMVRRFIEAGFPEQQVVTFGSLRGTNVLKHVERLHVVGRPMPPVDELPYLAQVIHHGERFVSAQVLLRAQGYGGQPYEVDVIDYEDERLAALLRAAREDEIIQAMHRGRLFSLSGPQMQLVDEAGGLRLQVDLVLHTNQPVPGLRVNELVLNSDLSDVNADRHEAARQRVRAAVLQLQEQCQPVNVSSVLRISGGSRTTVTKLLKEGVHTPKRDPSYRGMYTLPQTQPFSPSLGEAEAAAPDRFERNVCRGACGKAVADGQMCFDCSVREVEEWARRRRRRRVA